MQRVGAGMAGHGARRSDGGGMAWNGGAARRGGGVHGKEDGAAARDGRAQEWKIFLREMARCREEADLLGR